MNEETIWLGSAPAAEPCAQVGDPDYARDARVECRAFIEAIRKVCGREPAGAQLVVRGQGRNDGEAYYEVALVYDADDEWAARYAAHCDARAPATWPEAGMRSPVRHSRSR